MTDTTFVPGTVITKEWLNFVNDALHGTEQLNLYVSTTGSDSNDGLTVSTPFLTLQKAFDFLMARGHIGGKTTIHMAAGTYPITSSQRLGPANEDDIVNPNRDDYLKDGVNLINWLLIQGPDVGYDPLTNPWPTPTAIIDCNGASMGIQLEGVGIRVLVKNIKVIDATTIGVSNDGGSLRTENLHTNNCAIGVSSFRGLVEVRGGRMDGGGTKVHTGVRSMFLNEHEIGAQAAHGAGQGPLITNMLHGVHLQEGATGHIDSVNFEDCTHAIYCTVNSRANYAYCDFKRCLRCVRVEFNSVVYNAGHAEYHDGTADANEEKLWCITGGRSIDREPYAVTPSAFAFPSNGVLPMTITGTTSVITVLEHVLEKGWYAPGTSYSTRKPILLKMYASGNIADTRTGGGAPHGTIGDGVSQSALFSFRLGATLIAGVTTSINEYGDWVAEGVITLLDYNVQSGSMTLAVHQSNGGRPMACDSDTGTEDTRTTDTTLMFAIQPQNVGDIYTVNQCHFEVWG